VLSWPRSALSRSCSSQECAASDVARTPTHDGPAPSKLAHQTPNDRHPRRLRTGQHTLGFHVGAITALFHFGPRSDYRLALPTKGLSVLGDERDLSAASPISERAAGIHLT